MYMCMYMCLLRHLHLHLHLHTYTSMHTHVNIHRTCRLFRLITLVAKPGLALAWYLAHTHQPHQPSVSSWATLPVRPVLRLQTQCLSYAACALAPKVYAFGQPTAMDAREQGHCGRKQQDGE